MNDYGKKLYSDLCKLTENEAFYYQDFPLGDKCYRIFNYRLASYTDFLHPSALECRGIMFEISLMPELVSLPMEKFFNLNENPMTMDLDLSKVSEVELKADGSLISTYIHNGELRLKSKGSIASDQAIDAMKWLDQIEQLSFKMALLSLAEHGITINMEWCAPWNRIVIAYQQEGLVILNARYHGSGAYVTPEMLQHSGPGIWDAIESRWIQRLDTSAIGDMTTFVEGIPDMEDIEGYIIKLDNGDDTVQHVKIKTHWYLVQHRAKDSINSDRRLFETVVADAQDDLRSLFHDDEWVLDRISWMEGIVGHEYNHMVATVEDFFNENNELERKEYAIKAKAEVKPLWFGLCMSLYLGKPVDYKAFMMSKWKEYGIKDQRKGEE